MSGIDEIPMAKQGFDRNTLVEDGIDFSYQPEKKKNPG